MSIRPRGLWRYLSDDIGSPVFQAPMQALAVSAARSQGRCACLRPPRPWATVVAFTIPRAAVRRQAGTQKKSTPWTVFLCGWIVSGRTGVRQRPSWCSWTGAHSPNPQVSSLQLGQCDECVMRSASCPDVPLCWSPPPAGLEAAIFGLEVRRLVH